MPKLSVYVPDELWEKACQVDPLANRSQLIQRALERLLQGRTSEPSPLPQGAAEKISALREVFAAQAREEYETGYAGALEAAEAIPWHALEWFANERFDTRRWIDRVRGSVQTGIAYGEGEVPWVYAIAKSLGALADPIGYDQFSFTPTRARIRGFGDALRAVWESVDLETLGLVTSNPRDAADQDATDPAAEPGHGS